MKTYLSTNSKLAKSGISTWGIPAFKSASGKLTCPGAKDCVKGCYARQGFYVMPNVRKAQEERLALSESPEFVQTIVDEIKRRGIKRLRIHDSGDFYSLTYLRRWFEIAKACPETHFYAYTKMVAMFKAHVCPQVPPNFTVIFSYGGKWDHFINQTQDRHSRVFTTLSDLKKAGYSDAHDDDTKALVANHRVGLVYHGHKSKEWQS